MNRTLPIPASSYNFHALLSIFTEFRLRCSRIARFSVWVTLTRSLCPSVCALTCGLKHWGVAVRVVAARHPRPPGTWRHVSLSFAHSSAAWDTLHWTYKTSSSPGGPHSCSVQKFPAFYVTSRRPSLFVRASNWTPHKPHTSVIHRKRFISMLSSDFSLCLPRGRYFSDIPTKI
jgi:hypothetical protein